jgi:hypothetical protein
MTLNPKLNVTAVSRAADWTLNPCTLNPKRTVAALSRAARAASPCAVDMALDLQRSQLPLPTPVWIPDVHLPKMEVVDGLGREVL